MRDTSSQNIYSPFGFTKSMHPKFFASDNCGSDCNVVIAVIAMLLSATSWAEGNNQLWEVTTRTDMTDMSMPTVTRNLCWKAGEPYSPGKIPHQKHCQISDLAVSGDSTTWSIYCRGVNPMTGNGKVVQHEKTISGSVTLASKNIEMRQIISGKWVGNCK
jgi:hypothetical protein